MKLFRLRQKHPRLVYQDFEVKPAGKNLRIVFNFLLEPDIRFRPEISIPVPLAKQESPDGRQETPEEIRNLVFHLGLVEAISYWKAACPRELVVKAGYLSSGQIAWWKNLFIHGLGEFFFRNQIDFTSDNFLTITSPRKDQILTTNEKDLILTDRVSGDLILVGGGKDSIVTLETLKRLPGRKTALMLNPGPNSISAASIAGYQNPIIVTRIIDPRLLQLNKLGYLNGHTPFSAYLAFLGVLVAYLYGYKNVISSNELSAGEAGLIYKSMEINHQYSKSLAFEKNFRDYCRKYLFTKQESPGVARRLLNNINYFSFLRPLYELQISRLFSNLSSRHCEDPDVRWGDAAISSGLPRPFGARNDGGGKYDSTFVSCNAGRGKFWCGRCPKCAFNYLSLFPFMDAGRLKRIFGRGLFEIPEIQKHILDLVGLGQYKPFDCVGTKDESILAVALSIRKLRSEGKSVLDFLLSLEQKLHLIDQRINQESPGGARKLLIDIKKMEKRIMKNWSRQNFLPPEYSKILKKLLITTKR